MDTEQEKQKEFDAVQKKLKKGTLYKNYRDLCSSLGLTPKGGNAKQAQLKELFQFAEFEKQGLGFYVKSVYKTPREKKDGRTKGNNSVYLSHIRCLLIDLLLRSEEKKIILTKTQLAKRVGLINNDFYNSEEIKNKALPVCEVPKDIYKVFLKSVNEKANAVVSTALKNMQKDNIITANNVFLIRELTTGVCHIASEREEEVIKDIERECLSRIGVQSIVYLFLFDRNREFYCLCNQKYQALGWKSVYRAVKINLNNKAVWSDKEILCKKLVKQDLYEEVKANNHFFCNSVVNNTKPILDYINKQKKKEQEKLSNVFLKGNNTIEQVISESKTSGFENEMIESLKRNITEESKISGIVGSLESQNWKEKWEDWTEEKIKEVQGILAQSCLAVDFSVFNFFLNPVILECENEMSDDEESDFQR